MNLTKDTEKVIDILFSKDEALNLKKKISKGLPLELDRSFSCFQTPDSMERVWLSVVKLCKQTTKPVDYWIEFAICDWRDLFIAADFGNNTLAHIEWKKKVLTSRS